MAAALLARAGWVCPAHAAPLTLPEAVRLALDNNPQVAAADFEVAAAETKFKEARSNARLHLSLNASYIHLDEAPELSVAPISLSSLQGLMQMLHPGAPIPPMQLSIPGFALSKQDMRRYTLNAEQPLWTGGRVKHGVSQVRHGAAALDAAAQSRRRDIAGATAEAYLKAVLARRAAGVQQQAADTVAAHVAQAQALFDRGLIPKYELMRAQTELANASRRALDAANQADLAAAFLLDLMGLPDMAPPELTTDLNGALEFMLTYEQAVAEALENSPDMKALSERGAMYEAGVRSARADLRPVVAAVAQQDLRDEDLPVTQPDAFVGVVVKLPLLDGGNARARAGYNRRMQDRNAQDAERLANGIRLQVRKYYLDLQSAAKALEAADTAVALAKESLRLAERRFETGEGASLEVTDAALGLSVAETNLQNARCQYDTAYYGLLTAMGRIVEHFEDKGGDRS